MKKPILIILTESIRRDNHVPLQYFDKIRIYHFYKHAPYQEITNEELKGAIKYENLRDLKQKILQLKPDIIQGTEPYGSKQMFMLSCLAYYLSRRLNIPLIFPCWENRPLEEKFSFLKRSLAVWLMKKYIKQASLIFYLNEGAKNNLLKAGADSRKMIKFLWGTWGVDTELFSPKTRKQKAKIIPPTILFGGRLDRAKGLQYLMYAFLKVKKKIKNAKLILIGKGELEKWVRDFIDRHNLGDDVTLTGVIKTKDLPKYLHLVDVFACLSITLPWWAEQVGMINLQAMSCGVPVVSTFSGAIPEYVPNGKVGILVPEKNIEKTNQALIKLLKNQRLRLKLGEQAQQFAREHYSAKINVQKAQKILLHLIHHE